MFLFEIQCSGHRRLADQAVTWWWWWCNCAFVPNRRCIGLYANDCGSVAGIAGGGAG